MRPDYLYFLVENGDTSRVKIGHSINPVDRVNGYATGNMRGLTVWATLIGGQPMEAEFHKKFTKDQVDGEWFVTTPELLNYFYEKLVLQSVSIPRQEKSFGVPTSIPRVSLGEVEAAPVRPVARLGSVQYHSVSEVKQPKNPYANVGRITEKKP